MSNKLLASLVAALSLAACDERSTSTPVARVEPKVLQVIPSKAPVIPDAGVSLGVVEFVDAGTIDTLALTHDTPQVDHLARAAQLESVGDVKGALVEARRALFTTPDDVETLSRIAKLGRRARQPGVTAEAFGRIATLTPTDATPCIAQGRVLLDAKDGVGAIAAGRQAITRDEGNPEGWQILGLGQLSTNDLPGAIASFEKAVELAPNHGWALNNLGFAYLRANENKKAAEVLQRASVLLPTVAYVQNNLGVALERTSRPDDAKAAYQHAMDLSPKYVKARINAARMARVSQPELEVDDGESVSDVPADVHPMPEP
jgi:Flp pilus assembly protein TadD